MGVICSGTTLTLLIGENIIRNVDVSCYELASGKVGLCGLLLLKIHRSSLSFDWFKVSVQISHLPLISD